MWKEKKAKKDAFFHLGSWRKAALKVYITQKRMYIKKALTNFTS